MYVTGRKELSGSFRRKVKIDVWKYLQTIFMGLYAVSEQKLAHPDRVFGLLFPFLLLVSSRTLSHMTTNILSSRPTEINPETWENWYYVCLCCFSSTDPPHVPLIFPPNFSAVQKKNIRTYKKKVVPFSKSQPRVAYPWGEAFLWGPEGRIWPDDFSKKIFPGGPYRSSVNDVGRCSWRRRKVWRPVYVRERFGQCHCAG